MKLIITSPHIPQRHCTKDSFTFVKEIQEVSLNDSFLVSFDINSLFTNIPLHETINIAVKIIFDNYPEIKVTRDELTELFLFATARSHLSFNNVFYDQVDGVSMGSPLAPVLWDIMR